MTLTEILTEIRERLLCSGEYGPGWSATADATGVGDAMARIAHLEGIADARMDRINELEAQRDSWRRIAESGLGITSETPVQVVCPCGFDSCNRNRLKPNEYCWRDRQAAGLAQETEVCQYCGKELPDGCRTEFQGESACEGYSRPTSNRGGKHD
jgi:hypothetical protein